jgi:putative hemolysin
MFLFLLLMTCLIFVVLVLVTAIHPQHSQLNVFELERRAEAGDGHAKKALEREKLLVDIVSSQHILVALLQAIFVLFSELTFGWVIGTLVSLLVALGHGAIARYNFARKMSYKIYTRIEIPVLNFVKKHPRLFELLRNAPIDDYTYNLHVDSREELQHLVAGSDDVLTPDEKKLVINGLSFGDRLVRTAMTSRSEITSVKKSEFLGPLALNELHKIGHSRLPVTDGDIDHIVGILHTNSLLTLDNKRSTTAEKAMEAKVFYIREDQTLQHALAAFLHTRHVLFIVVNELRETVGLLTIGDVIEALLGREIIDEFDSHDNLYAVASRDLKPINCPKDYKDV